MDTTNKGNEMTNDAAVTYKCRHCKRTTAVEWYAPLPTDRCPSAGPKGWHLWKRVSQVTR